VSFHCEDSVVGSAGTRVLFRAYSYSGLTVIIIGHY
jgi:hypothetical protein